MRRRSTIGALSCLLAVMACAPTAPSSRPAITQPAGQDVRVVPSGPPPAPAVRVSTGPKANPSPAPVTPAASPERPEEAVPLEPASTAPSAPAVTVAATDESAWVASLRADFAASAVSSLADVALNRDAEVPVTSAIGFNVPDSHQPVGFLWNAGDREVDEWMPQGVGGFARDGHRWLVVTWYAKDAVEGTQDPAQALSYRGARLSLVDITDPAHVSYRHVLLVQDAANIGAKGLFRMGQAAKAGYHQGDRFAPVPIHAGGVEVYDHWVYVVDTALGVRQFDLNQLFKAEADPAKSSCGVVDGAFKAFDYRFVLPEVAHYQITGASPYSCLSLDAPGMTMWVGQYLAEADAERSAVTGLALGADGKLGDRATTRVYPKDTGGAYAHRMQGVFRRNGQTWMSITGQSRYEGSTARLALYEDGKSEGQRWRWPQGAEDLYYEDATDTLWCLTEFSDSLVTQRGRCVFGVKLSTYQAP